MRNSFLQWISVSVLTIVSIAASGCGPDQQAKRDLTVGYDALEAQQYDQAIASADAYLQQRPNGVGTAEALYLRGRGLEQRTVHSNAEAQANLQAARSAYIEALSKNPSPKLEAYLHTSLANVAYFQEDYGAAEQEWTKAYEQLDDEGLKSWVLYRVGLCRQRMDHFSEADQIFATVQQKYPNTVPAQRAREHQGARAFTVQFATFASPANADTAIAGFRRDGVNVLKQTDRQGRAIIVSTPQPTYRQAQALKARYALTYPSAIILP
jgi:TolA-binding protein